MSRLKSVRKTLKRIRNTDQRLNESVKAQRILDTKQRKIEKEREEKLKSTHIAEKPASLFFSANLALGPPYHVILDTNFINFSIQNKIDIFKGLMDLLHAKCIPTLTDCVVAELEKMGPKYRLALHIANDPRFARITCSHSKNYADDCIVNTVEQAAAYLVATNDKDLRNRIRKVPGIPLISVRNHKYHLERLPDVML